MTPTTVHVSAEVEYDVVIGPDLLPSLNSMLTGADRVAIIHAPTQRTRAHDISILVGDCGMQVTEIELPDAEDAKSSSVAASRRSA